MILEVEDYEGNTIFAVQTERNDFGEEEVINTKGNISIADRDFDDIFGTNDFKTRLQLETELNFPLNKNKIAENIIDDIVSSRKGEIYDEEILDIYTNDYFSHELEEIKLIIDDKIGKYLCNDGLTIRDD